MYTEKHLYRLLINALHYTMAHLRSAEKKRKLKSPPQDVFCQLRAVEGGIQKIIYKLFDEALRKDLAVRIN